MIEVIAAIGLVFLVLIPGSAFAYWVPDSYGQGIGPGLPGPQGGYLRQSRSQYSLAWKHTVRNIWKSGQSICASLWRLSGTGILPSRTVLVVSSLVVPSISDMAARSDIEYTDLWIREYGWRDPRPRTGWRILGNFPYFQMNVFIEGKAS